MGPSTPEQPVVRGKERPQFGCEPKIRAEKLKIGETY